MNKADLLIANLSSEQVSRLKKVEDELNAHKSELNEIILLAYNKVD